MKRWYIYLLVGLSFGVIDWFYLDWLTFDFSYNLRELSFWIIPIMFIMNYGIWLVPLIPAVIFESRKADRIRSPILARYSGLEFSHLQLLRLLWNAAFPW